MRSIVLLLITPMLTQARVCGANEAQPPVPVASAQVTVGAAPVAVGIAKHGGQVVAVDDVQVELLVKGDGEVVAYPVQAAASAPATLTADAEVTVEVPVQSGGTRPVNLVWVPAEARFVGRVRGARVVTTQPADVNVTVVSHGRRRHHRVERVVVAPAVVVAAPQPTVVVNAPQPRVIVQAPQPTVVVAAPQPTVVVQHPGVIVGARAPGVVVAAQAPSVDIRLGVQARTNVVVAGPQGPGPGRPNQKHRDRGNHFGHDDDHGGRHGGHGGHGGRR